MLKYSWVLFSCLFSFLYCRSQDIGVINYAGKLNTSPKNGKDSIPFRSYDHVKLHRISVRVSAFRDGVLHDSANIELRDPTLWYQWKDSIAVNIPLRSYLNGNYTSLALLFTYHFLGWDDTRGGERRAFEVMNASDTVKYISLKLISYPSGAEAYLIPKYLYESRHPPLEHFMITKSTTPVWVNAREYVYLAFFRLKGKEKRVECAPMLSQPIDSVSVHF